MTKILDIITIIMFLFLVYVFLHRDELFEIGMNNYLETHELYETQS